MTSTQETTMTTIRDYIVSAVIATQDEIDRTSADAWNDQYALMQLVRTIAGHFAMSDTSFDQVAFFHDCHYNGLAPTAQCDHDCEWDHYYDEDSALGDYYHCSRCGELTQVG